MQFEWDENKRQQNLLKHDIDFIRINEIWSGRVVECSSPQVQHGETRYVAIGELDGRYVTVIYTWRGQTRRIISARKARRNEKENYQNEIG